MLLSGASSTERGERYASVVVPGGGGGGGGGEPTTPADTQVGLPAYRMVCWGGDTYWAYVGGPTNVTWFSRGHEGYLIGSDYPEGFGGSTYWKASDSSGEGSNYQAQQYQESTGHDYAATAKSAGMEIGISWKFHSNSYGAGYPAFGDWFNDTTWTSVVSRFTTHVQAVSYLGMDHIGLDFEYSSWAVDGYTGDTHTDAENRTQARQRGYDLAYAIWGVKSDLRLYLYDQRMPAGYRNRVFYYVYGTTIPYTGYVYQDFIQGLFDGMNAVGGDGEIVLLEAEFYRTAGQNVNNGAARQDSAYKIDSQGTRAWISSNWDQDVWDFAASRLRTAGFTWRGTDGLGGFYDSTQPSDSAWSTMLGQGHDYGEGSRRAEFTGPAPGWSGGHSYYSDATSITGSQDAASTSSLTTTGPTVETSAAASVTSSEITITIQVRDDYGVACVRVYRGSTFNAADPEASFEGCMNMTWNEGTGSLLAAYTDDYQDCTWTSTTTDWATNDWAVLGIFGIRADSFSGLTGETTWVTVQAA